ncbi:unnamed protein product [Cochlearia groenlandica]
MRTLELASPPSPPSLVPFHNYSAAKIAGTDIRTSFDFQLLLRKPKHHKPEPIVITHPQIHTKPIPRCSTSDILRLMDSLSLNGDEELYSCLAKESTTTCDPREAHELQVHVMKSNLRPTTTFLNRLLLMQVSCGRLDIARHMFDKMPHRDFHSWAIVILGCLETGNYQDAVSLFVSMSENRNVVSKIQPWFLGLVLKACGEIRDFGLGKQVHGLSYKVGFIEEEDSYLSGSLIRFYGEFKRFDEADLVLYQLSNVDTVVWAAKVANDYGEGEFREVIRGFVEMGKLGIKKNVSVFSYALKASTWLNDGGRSGRGVHADAVKLGFESDCMVRSRLIEMYGKYGMVKDAEKAFVYERSVACWNAMVAGYMQNGFYIEAIKLLYHMKANGVKVQDMLLRQVNLKPSIR